MPATTTLVSITTRGLRSLVLRGNGNLRRPPFPAIVANGTQDFFFGNLAHVFCCVCQGLQKFLLPPPAFATPGQIAIEIGVAQSSFNLLTEGAERNRELERGVIS